MIIIVHTPLEYGSYQPRIQELVMLTLLGVALQVKADV